MTILLRALFLCRSLSGCPSPDSKGCVGTESVVHSSIFLSPSFETLVDSSSRDVVTFDSSCQQRSRWIIHGTFALSELRVPLAASALLPFFLFLLGAALLATSFDLDKANYTVLLEELLHKIAKGVSPFAENKASLKTSTTTVENDL